MLSCELIVKFQNWTFLWDSTNLKMSIMASVIPVQYILDEWLLLYSTKYFKN